MEFLILRCHINFHTSGFMGIQYVVGVHHRKENVTKASIMLLLLFVYQDLILELTISREHATK